MARIVRYCPGCGLNRDIRFWSKQSQRTCDTCRKKARSDSAHRSRVKATYGLESEDYERLLAHQHGRCAICGSKRGYRLNVDHDHRTGLVRGLLCRRCNKLLMLVRDVIDLLWSAAAYLVSPPAEQLGIRASAGGASSEGGEHLG
jgi:hypothetical protein